MPFLSEDHREISTKDILSWYFDEPQCNQDEPIYIDAADTSRSYSHRQAKRSIRKVAAGLKALGLKKGDTVCLHSFNDV
jgi:4-coumarate--CoA ligase